MMWWLSLNLNQVALLIAGLSSMTPITINLDPLYEFIVLGVIPGTTTELDFISVLFIMAAIPFFVLVHRTDFSLRRPQHN